MLAIKLVYNINTKGFHHRKVISLHNLLDSCECKEIALQ